MGGEAARRRGGRLGASARAEGAPLTAEAAAGTSRHWPRGSAWSAPRARLAAPLPLAARVGLARAQERAMAAAAGSAAGARR